MPPEAGVVSPGASAEMAPEDPFKSVLLRVSLGTPLSADEAEAAFGLIMDGAASESRIAGFLMALRARAEREEELLGAVRAVRARMLTLPDVPADAIDVCGTGGDGHGTLNVSTAVSFVLAALGVPVAKHGNRALSSRSGAVDVLGALGVPVAADPASTDVARLAADLREKHLVFLAAPNHHPAMRHAGPARRALAVPTLFNLVGPLSNPAGVKRQLLGVFDCRWLEPIVTVLRSLGSERVWAICGRVTDAQGRPAGIDEVTLAGSTDVVALEPGEGGHGTLHRFTLLPEMAGLAEAPLSAIAGGTPTENASVLEAMLRGEAGAYRDTVLFNAACALHVAGRGNVLRNGTVDTGALRELVARAALVVDNGAALAALNAVRADDVIAGTR